MGMITAILGLLFLSIKGKGESFSDLYSENPNKKKSHFKFGLLLSICLIILYLPVIFLGYALATVFGGYLVLVVMCIMLLNILIGVVTFFFKEKLNQISIGIIPSIPLIFCLIILDLYFVSLLSILY